MMNRILCAIALLSLLQSTNAQEYSGPIIDMHVHAYTDTHPLMGITHPPTLRGETYEGVRSGVEQKEKTLEQFRRHNIVKAVVTNGQLWLNDAPEAILIGNAYEPTDSLRRQRQEGKLHMIAEMQPFYSGKLANDPTVLPYYELADELDIPVGIHLLPGGPNGGIHVFPKMLSEMRTYNANPQQLEDVLVQFPDLKLCIMHGGWPYVEDLKALMYAHPDVFVELGGIAWVLPKEELYSYLKALINAGFGDRIMFGSDQMVWPQTIGFGIETVNSADFLTPEQKEDIFYDNAASFLGLSEEEIARHKAYTETRNR